MGEWEVILADGWGGVEEKENNFSGICMSPSAGRQEGPIFPFVKLRERKNAAAIAMKKDQIATPSF